MSHDDILIHRPLGVSLLSMILVASAFVCGSIASLASSGASDICSAADTHVELCGHAGMAIGLWAACICHLISSVGLWLGTRWGRHAAVVSLILIGAATALTTVACLPLVLVALVYLHRRDVRLFLRL